MIEAFLYYYNTHYIFTPLFFPYFPLCLFKFSLSSIIIFCDEVITTTIKFKTLQFTLLKRIYKVLIFF